MSRLTFPLALTASGLLTLTLALVSSWVTVPWITYAGILEAGPSPIPPVVVLAFTIAMSLATLGWGVWRMRLGGDEQPVTFPQVLVLAGILGLGVVGSLSIWTVYFISVLEWAEGFHLSTLYPVPSEYPDPRAEPIARGLLDLRFPTNVPSSSTSYTGTLVMQLVAVVLPLAVLLEGFRRMLLARRDPSQPVERLVPARLLVVLAFFVLMVTCAAAPVPLHAITGAGASFRSFVAGELLSLGVGFAVPIAALTLAVIAHRKRGLRDSPLWPGVIAVLVVAIAAGPAADHWASPTLVIGTPLAGLLWAALVAGRTDDAPLTAGRLLGAVALVGLLICGLSTRGAASTIERGLLLEVTHGWLIAVVVMTYAVNLCILAAAVWRLRVESRQEPVPEPEGV